ncbi:Fic family protein [Bradyrhizobium sp. F1.13.1]
MLVYSEASRESLRRRTGKKIAKTSQPTATRDINDLIKRGILQKDAAGRGAAPAIHLLF